MDNQVYIQRETETRSRLEAEARGLLDRASDETRDLSPEEEEQFDKLIAQSGRHKERIDKLERMDAAADLGPEARAVVGAAAALEAPTVSWDTQLADTIRSVFDTFKGGGQVPGEINLPEIRAGRAPFGQPWESRVLATLAGVDVPTDFSTRVALYQRTVSPWVGLATIINGTDGAPIQLPRITTDPTVYTPGQGTAITEASPVLTATTATPVAYKALTAISQEMAQDEVISIMDYIARTQGRSLGLAFGSATTTAVLAAATNGGTATIGTPYFGLDDLIDLVYARAVPYRSAGSFIMATGAVSKARKLKDVDGQYLWQPSNAAGEPDRLLGFPVYEDPYLATPASATKSVLFGDASAWVIKQLPLRVAVSSEYLFNLDQVAIKTVYRAGGALPDTAALAYLVSSNT